MYFEDLPKDSEENTQKNSDLCDMYDPPLLNKFSSQYTEITEIEKPSFPKAPVTLENISEVFTFQDTRKEQFDLSSIDNRYEHYLKNHRIVLRFHLDNFLNLTLLR